VACRHREFKMNVNVRTLTVISMFEFTCCDSEPAGEQESDDCDRKKCCAHLYSECLDDVHRHVPTPIKLQLLRFGARGSNIAHSIGRPRTAAAAFAGDGLQRQLLVSLPTAVDAWCTGHRDSSTMSMATGLKAPTKSVLQSWREQKQVGAMLLHS